MSRLCEKKKKENKEKFQTNKIFSIGWGGGGGEIIFFATVKIHP